MRYEWAKGRWLVGIVAATTMAQPFARGQSLRSLRRDLSDLRSTVQHYMKILKPPGPKTSRELTKRLMDGLVLYRLKDHDKAAILFMDLVSANPASRAGQEARFYLADCLYHRREFVSAKVNFQAVVDRGETDSNYQKALQRLLELSMRTGDHSRVHQLIGKIQQIPKEQRDHSMEYVLGKYYYFRQLGDQARQVFESIGRNSKYHRQAQYFLGVVAVKQNRLKDAEKIFRSSLLAFAEKEKGKGKLSALERQLFDLFILGLARLHYHRAELDKAISLYKAISRRSKFFDDALYELAWAYLSSRELGRSIRVLELLVLAKPNHPAVPESKILLANLKLLSRQYVDARKLFKRVARRYRPVFLRVRHFRKMRLPVGKFYDMLLGKGQDVLEMQVELPSETIAALKRQPQVRKALQVIGDMQEIRTNIKVCDRIIKRIERRLKSSSRISAFPVLARARANAVEVEIQLAKVRGKLVDMLRKAAVAGATGSEKRQLEFLSQKRRRLERLLAKMPASGDAFEKRVAKIRKLYEAKDAQAHKLGMALDTLRATLVAIENYHKMTAGQQKVPSKVVKTKVGALKKEVAALEDELEAVRDSIVDARTVAGIDDSTMEAEKKVRNEYRVVLMEQTRTLEQIKSRLGSARRRRMDRVAKVLGTAGAVAGDLSRFNKRIERLLAYRLGRLLRILGEEKVNLAEYKRLLKGYQPETREVAGGVTKDGFAAVAKEFYKLVVKADVGILDVAWAVKSDLSESWAQRSRVQSKQIRDLDARFREVRGK